MSQMLVTHDPVFIEGKLVTRKLPVSRSKQPMWVSCIMAETVKKLVDV